MPLIFGLYHHVQRSPHPIAFKWHIHRFQGVPSAVHDGSVASLRHRIFLRCIRCGRITVDAFCVHELQHPFRKKFIRSIHTYSGHGTIKVVFFFVMASRRYNSASPLLLRRYTSFNILCSSVIIICTHNMLRCAVESQRCQLRGCVLGVDVLWCRCATLFACGHGHTHCNLLGPCPFEHIR